MKKLIHIALLCITSIAFSQDKKTSNSTAINAQITFGRQSLDCRGRGTCSFEKVESIKEANAIVTYNKDNTITLIIDRTKITKEDEAKIVGKPIAEVLNVNKLVFTIQDDLTLETEIKSNLKTEQNITKIAKGNYPIQVTKETFTITIKLE